MPTYEYSCPTCGSFDAEQRITAPAFSACPTCGSPEVKRLISKTSFALKGGGWYADGYQSTGPTKKASESAPPPSGCGAGACGGAGCAAAKAMN